MEQKIVDIINNDYSEENRKTITDYLLTIKLSEVWDSNYNLENTLLSILYLANGNIDIVIELTEKAKKDFRDVIYWATEKQKDSLMELPNTKEKLLNTYYLKKDLQKLCKKYALPTTGSKAELLDNLINFIEKKPINKLKDKPKILDSEFVPALHKKINKYYSNNETHRAFFKEIIGRSFKFNVQFMNWMERNKGIKTYNEAVEMYRKIISDKKSGKESIIGKQFEYNKYTRDFFKDNPNLKKMDCIKCWNYKKKQTGSHIYEKKDLKILDK